MNKIVIQNPRIINEGRSFIGSVLVEGDKIAAVFEGEVPGNVRAEANQVIDATGKWLIPGVIDDQVHFRDPGLTHKGDIGTESRAAVAGGVTTFMDMPNTKPQTTTIADLEWKFNRAAVYGKYAGGQERLVGAYLRRGRYADRHPCGERGGDPA